MKKLMLIMSITLSLLLFSCAPSPNLKTGRIEALSLDENVLGEALYSENRMAISNGKNGREERWGYMNEKGDIVIPTKCYPLDYFSDGRVRTVLESGFWCYLNENGDVAISQVEEKDIKGADVFKDGYACIYLDGVNGHYVIDTDGEVILEPGSKGYYYENIGQGLFTRLESGNSIAMIVQAIDGEILYQKSIGYLACLNDGMGFYSLDSEIYGLWNDDSKTKITNPQFSFISKFSEGVALVKDISGDFKIINKKGDNVASISEKLKNLNDAKLNPFSDSVSAISYTDKKGTDIIDAKGNIIKQTKYDDVHVFYEGIAVCEKDGLYGYVDKNGNEILSPTYDYASNIVNGVGFLSKDGKTFRYSIK